MDDGRLEARICRHEGYEHRPYRDTKGFWTVGWGHKIHDMDLTLMWLNTNTTPRTLGELMDALADKDQHLAWLTQDIKNATAIARSWFGNYWYEVDPIRQEVLVEMCFWMGNRARGFKLFKAAAERKDWGEASRQMLDSKAGREFEPRMSVLATIMQTGRP